MLHESARKFNLRSAHLTREQGPSCEAWALLRSLLLLLLMKGLHRLFPETEQHLHELRLVERILAIQFSLFAPILYPSTITTGSLPCKLAASYRPVTVRFSPGSSEK